MLISIERVSKHSATILGLRVVTTAENKYVCFRFPDPTLVFAPTLNILLLIVSKILSNMLINGEKCSEKCNVHINYFDKIK